MIASKKSKPIWEYSAIPKEKETLFSPNSQFQIISKFSKANKKFLQKAFNIDLQGLIIYDLKEI